MSFIRNAWYVAGWSEDFGRTLTARTVLGEPLVLFRQRNSELVALKDRCPHRSLPLSMGTLIDDTLECGYHGLTFDASGRCVRVPGQDIIPDGARVRRFPVHENMGLAWVWMGDEALAEQAPVYDLAQYHEPDWGVGHGDAMHVKANYIALADNLCDPAHVSFVHKSTLGSAAEVGIPVHSEERGDTVLTWRWTLNSPPVGFFKVFGNFTGNVDRWQYYYLHAPSTAIIDFGSAAAGTGAPQGDRSNCVQVYSCHFLTPETESTTIDYWLHVRNFAAEDAGVSDQISEQFRIAFAEDKSILEAIQAQEEREPGVAPVHIAIDAGPARLRRVLRRLHQLENNEPKHGDTFSS